MSTVAMEQRKRIHPHKFTLWVGIGSILMMFAGFTSAYIVKRNQANWVTFDLPVAFWYSTAVIIVKQSYFVHGTKAFKQRDMAKYRSLMAVTLVLGIVFIVLQVIGFSATVKIGVTLTGKCILFFFICDSGIHAVHVLGGIIALIVMFVKAFTVKSQELQHCAG